MKIHKFIFQFYGKHYFTWEDRFATEHNLSIENSNCDFKSSILRSDYVQISDKSILPVTKVYYGPLEFEMDKMKIVVGSLVCQPDPDKQNGIEDRIEKLDTALEYIELQNNRTQDIMSNYSEKFNYFEDVLDDHREEHLVFHELIKNHTETQIDIQVEIEEQQPSAFQGEIKKYKEMGQNDFKLFKHYN